MKKKIKDLQVGELVRKTKYTQLWLLAGDPGIDDGPLPLANDDLGTESALIFIGGRKAAVNVMTAVGPKADPIDVQCYAFWFDGKVYLTRDPDQNVIIVE